MPTTGASPLAETMDSQHVTPWMDDICDLQYNVLHISTYMLHLHKILHLPNFAHAKELCTFQSHSFRLVDDFLSPSLPGKPWKKLTHEFLATRISPKTSPNQTSKRIDPIIPKFRGKQLLQKYPVYPMKHFPSPNFTSIFWAWHLNKSILRLNGRAACFIGGFFFGRQKQMKTPCSLSNGCFLGIYSIKFISQVYGLLLCCYCAVSCFTILKRRIKLQIPKKCSHGCYWTVGLSVKEISSQNIMDLPPSK